MGFVAKNDLSQMKWGDGTNSSAGTQIRTDYYDRRALIEAQREQYFQPLASTRDMPRNYGQKITLYHFLPLLDARNDNDQGIDAEGATIDDGNLYGSSKDIGTINDKLPVLSETGGRVNRVGYSRQTVEGTIEHMGFFHEFTRDSLDFDSMADLYEHLSRELVNGANEIYEDMLQIDLLDGAGVKFYAGAATSMATITGEGSDISAVTYEDLQRLSIRLDDNLTPKSTQIITGSRMVDTATIGSGRLLYVGSELQIQLEKMRDAFNNKAFVPVEQYAYSGDYRRGQDFIFGEIGKIGQFRIVVVPKMLHWAGQGADVTDSNTAYRNTTASGSTKYDVFPMLTIGSESFTTIGFNVGSNNAAGNKFRIIARMPGESTAGAEDPFGLTGFSSIQWWYGSMIMRPERIGVIHTVAEM